MPLKRRGIRISIDSIILPLELIAASVSLLKHNLSLFVKLFAITKIAEIVTVASHAVPLDDFFVSASGRM